MLTRRKPSLFQPHGSCSARSPTLLVPTEIQPEDCGWQ